MKRYLVRLSVLIIVLIFLLITLTIEHSTLKITAVGDIRISERFIKNYLPTIEKIHLSGDLTFANFEGVLSEKTFIDPFLLTMPYETSSVLKAMGIDYLSLANNHSLDLGVDQYQETYRRLKREGFRIAGYVDLGEVIKVKNRTIRIIGFSFNSLNDVNDLDKATEIIKSCHEDLIIVSAHMGGESGKGYLIPNGMEFFGAEQRGDVVKFSHACIDAGADLIIGHSPHILRKIEVYQNKLIVYSLGNFIFDYPGVERHMHSPGFSISIFLNAKGDFKKAKINSYDLRNGIPVFDNGHRAFRFIKKLSLKNKTNLIFKSNGWVYPQ